MSPGAYVLPCAEVSADGCDASGIQEKSSYGLMRGYGLEDEAWGCRLVPALCSWEYSDDAKKASARIPSSSDSSRGGRRAVAVMFELDESDIAGFCSVFVT
jgi:hypothetical protein